MAIIVVSTQMGAGGPEIGMALAQKCGYRYVDQELLQDAGRRYGLAEERLSHLDESKPTIFERFDAETRHHITVLQTTLLELAELDNAVFMRGGGQWLLRGVPHVLRVRLIAPFEHRVKQWIKRVASMTGETPNPRAAAEFVRRDDAEKAGRMRYLYEVDIADPMLYELIVNTEMVRHDAVVQMLETLARRPGAGAWRGGSRAAGPRAPGPPRRHTLGGGRDINRIDPRGEHSNGRIARTWAFGCLRIVGVGGQARGARASAGALALEPTS